MRLNKTCLIGEFLGWGSPGTEKWLGSKVLRYPNTCNSTARYHIRFTRRNPTNLMIGPTAVPTPPHFVDDQL